MWYEATPYCFSLSLCGHLGPNSRTPLRDINCFQLDHVGVALLKAKRKSTDLAPATDGLARLVKYMRPGDRLHDITAADAAVLLKKTGAAAPFS